MAVGRIPTGNPRLIVPRLAQPLVGRDRELELLGQLLEDTALVTIGEPGTPDASQPPEELFFRLQADVQGMAGEADLESGLRAGRNPLCLRRDGASLYPVPWFWRRTRS